MENNNLIKEIKKLKQDINPRQDWVNLSRDILLRQIDQKIPNEQASLGIGDYGKIFTQVFRQRIFEPAVVMLLVLGVFLGSSLTINAAFYSLPGDGLYPLKITLEKTHVALVPDEEKKVELKIEFAQKRVAEFGKIVQSSDGDPQSKKKKIEAMARELKNNVAAVNSHLEKINQSISAANVNDSDKERTVRMAISISSKTEELVKSVEETVGSLPDTEQREVGELVADAVEVAQDTSISAHQLAEGANAEEQVEEGTVQGASNESEDLIPPESEESTSSTQQDPEGEIIDQNIDSADADTTDDTTEETAE